MLDENSKAQADGALFTDSYTDIMRFTPDTYFTFNGECYKVLETENNPDTALREKYRILIKKEWPPLGAAVSASFFIENEELI